MATEILQDLEGLSVSAHLDQGYLHTDISNFEEVEEIVKSNLRMISHMTHDENAQDGFPEHHDEYADLLGMLNMPSSDLEEKDATESNVNEKPMDKDEGHNESCFNFENAVKSPEMPQASKDLLDDITFVINSDKNFINDHHLVSSSTEGVKRDRKEILSSDQAVGKLDVSSRLLSKKPINTVVTEISLSDECQAEHLDSPSRDHQQGNLHHILNLPAKDVYFEQSLHDLLDGASSEVLTPPQEQHFSQENLFKALTSLDSLSESSLVERSCTMFPGQSFRNADATVKESAESGLAPEPDDDQDVTVDGEGEDNFDGGSLDLCPLSYDENLTCSFYELLQLHNDDNSELIEHGQRGRPSRKKINRQAVPCKIEPKVSQPSLQPGFLPPQLFYSTFQNYQPGLTSVIPSKPQPCFGQELVRFPVLLHRKTNSYGQLYLEVCPDIMQLTTSSQAPVVSSAPQPDNSSPKCNSEKSGSSSSAEVAPEKTQFRPSLDSSSHMLGDISKVSQNQFSLEIDGPIRRQAALSQGRYGSSRNDPYFRVAMGNSAHASGSAGPPMGNSAQAMGSSGQAVGNSGHASGSSGHTVRNSRDAFGSPVEEPYRIPGVHRNHNFTVNSHNIVPTSFVSSNPNLIRVQDASGFGRNVQNPMPYISTGMEGTFYQNIQNVPVSDTSVNYGTHDQLSQFPLSTNNCQYSNNASSTNTDSHHLGQGVSGDSLGNWMSKPNINMVGTSVSQENNNNPPRHTVPSGAIPYARISAPGLPNIPVDPLSRRVQMLMAMGGHGQRHVNVDSSSLAVYSSTTSQNVGKFPASNNEYDDSMIQLSPPAELRNPQFVGQQSIIPPGPAHVPSSGATADGSVMNKSAFHPKSAPSHSSTRSSKGPDLPVPTEKSKTRVEQWLKNNVMFRPDLDSGTFDPSDYSLVHADLSHQYPEAAGSEGASSEQSYEYVGIFAGKRITMVPPQASTKQKPNKRTIAAQHHRKESPLIQAGQSRQSIISDASVITESSLSSGHTNSSKSKHTEGKQEALNVYQNKTPGRRPVARNTETPTSAFATSNQEFSRTRQEELPMSTQGFSSYPLDKLDENQQADLAIAEGVKLLEQTSIEKRLAGISSPTSSGHVLSELEQFLRSENKSSSDGTSGNPPGSSFKLEAAISGNSKHSSFDTSKYITPSDIESLEKKKTQNDKNSWDNYLEHVKYVSNESMHAELTASDQSDGKQLENIPLNEITEVIGLQKELNQQPSKHEHCLPHSQFENRQKAVKRRPIDHSGETVYQMEQKSETGGQNAEVGEKSVTIGGHHLVLGDQNVIVTGHNTLLGRQNGAVAKDSRTGGGQIATVCEQNTAACGQNATLGRMSMTNLMQNNKIPQMLASVPGMVQVGQNISAECLPLKLETPNFGNQDFILFSEQGRIHQTVVGPPTTQPDFLLKNSITQYARFPVSSTAVSGLTQTNPTYASQSFQAVTAQTLHSDKILSDFPLPNFTDSFETEMRSTPSSVEILKESRSSFNNNFFTVPDTNRNEISSMSSMKHVMPSAATKIYPAVELLPQSSCSAHSATTSASHISRTQFKKPQNPSCSGGSSVTTYRPEVTTYPSVGGDSDVSMNSDTCLPNCMTLHEGSMDPNIQTLQQQKSAPQNVEQYSLQFQQLDSHQLGQTVAQSTQQPAGQNMLQNTQAGQNILHGTQQQVGQIMLQSSQQVGQNMPQSTTVVQKMLQSKQQQVQNKILSQQCYGPQMQQSQHQLLLQQQKHLQMEQAKKQQQMENQHLLMQNQKQNSSQDYYQVDIQQMLNQQTLHFPTKQQMDSQQQQQEMQNSHLYCEDSQQIKLRHLHNQQQFEELLQQQQQLNQQEQFDQIQTQKQQQTQKQRHFQQQMINQQPQQIQSHQPYLQLQNPQQLHIQQLQKQPGENSHSHQLQNQQQIQQFKQLLNQQHYQQMQAQQLQQEQIKKHQQQEIENYHLQQQQRLSQNSSTFTNICIPQRTPGSRAGSTCSEPQPSRILPGTKFETRSMSQICDSGYSRQLTNLSPTSERDRDLQTFNAVSDKALVFQSSQQLTGNSNQQVHRENAFDNMHKNSMSGQNIETFVQNFNQHISESQTPCSTATSSQQPSSGNIDMAEQDQVLKSATETQLQKYLKEGFPSLNSAEYCHDTVAGPSSSPLNIPSLVQDQQQQNVAKTGQGMDSGDGSNENSNRVRPAERSREEADSDLSVFSLSSGDDLLSFQQDNDGETPLHLLSELPKEGISSLPSMPGFYEALNLQNKNQETALDIAVKNENLNAVKFLVSHGADVNIFCLSSQKGTGSKAVHRNETVQQTALHEAVELGNREIVKVLLTSQNVKVDARRPDSGLTPLMLALQLHRQSDRREIISELINHQASLHLHDTIQGKTPLMLAIQSRDVSLVEGILQQVGAEEARGLVSVRAKKDMTCLHFAAELRLESSLKKRLLRCIIVAGGDPSAKNSEGETPRDWAKTEINEVLQNLARLFNP